MNEETQKILDRYHTLLVEQQKINIDQAASSRLEHLSMSRETEHIRQELEALRVSSTRRAHEASLIHRAIERRMVLGESRKNVIPTSSYVPRLVPTANILGPGVQNVRVTPTEEETHKRLALEILQNVEVDYDNLIASARWNVGRTLCRPLTFVSRETSPATIEEDFRQLLNNLNRMFSLSTTLPDFPGLNAQEKLTQLEATFAKIFDLKEWRVGHSAISIVEKFLRRKTSPPLKSRIEKKLLQLNIILNQLYAPQIPSNTADEQDNCKARRLVGSTNKSPLVSVIIPVFNKEEHLYDCLKSLLENSHSNLEIICVDDASTDQSRQIIANFTTDDKRLRSHFLESNQGASAARNLGLNLATGDYIAFLDADDVMPPQALTNLVQRAEDTDADIVRGKITGLREDGSRHILAAEKLLHDRDAERVLWAEEESLWFYWYFTANLYRRQFLTSESIRFPTGIRNEDPQFLCRCFMSTDKISLLNEYVYRYRIGAEQQRKTPSPSFLRGFSVGNYSIAQSLQNHDIAMQYFLVQLPNVRQHAQNMAKCLNPQDSLKLIKYLALMYAKLDLDLITSAGQQPWARKRVFSLADAQFFELLSTRDIYRIYESLL